MEEILKLSEAILKQKWEHSESEILEIMENPENPEITGISIIFCGYSPVGILAVSESYGTLHVDPEQVQPHKLMLFLPHYPGSSLARVAGFERSRWTRARMLSPRSGCMPPRPTRRGRSSVSKPALSFRASVSGQVSITTRSLRRQSVLSRCA